MAQALTHQRIHISTCGTWDERAIGAGKKRNPCFCVKIFITGLQIKAVFCPATIGIVIPIKRGLPRAILGLKNPESIVSPASLITMGLGYWLRLFYENFGHMF